MEIIDETKKKEIEDSLKNLNAKDRESILNCRLINVKNKKKKLLKVRKVFAIATLSGIFAMLGGVALMASATFYKDKVSDIVNKSEYSFYNAQHKFEEEKKLLEQLENNEISVQEYQNQKRRIKNLEEDEVLKNCLSEEEYKYYKQKEKTGSNLLKIGGGILGAGIVISLSSALIAEKKSYKIKKQNEEILTLEDMLK